MQRFLILILIVPIFSILVACDRDEIDAPTSENGGYAIDPKAESAPAEGGAESGAGEVPHFDESDGSTARFAGLRATLPESWIVETPTSSMRAVQMKVPGSAGDEDSVAASFVVFTGISGTVAGNVARWEGQFDSDDQGHVVHAGLEEQTNGDLKITTATLTGTYAGGMNGEFAGPNVTMMQSLVEKPTGEIIFVRLLGPTDTVMANREQFAAFLNSIR